MLPGLLPADVFLHTLAFCGKPLVLRAVSSGLKHFIETIWLEQFVEQASMRVVQRTECVQNPAGCQGLLLVDDMDVLIAQRIHHTLRCCCSDEETTRCALAAVKRVLQHQFCVSKVIVLPRGQCLDRLLEALDWCTVDLSAIRRGDDISQSEPEPLILECCELGLDFRGALFPHMRSVTGATLRDGIAELEGRDPVAAVVEAYWVLASDATALRDVVLGGNFFVQLAPLQSPERDHIDDLPAYCCGPSYALDAPAWRIRGHKIALQLLLLQPDNYPRFQADPPDADPRAIKKLVGGTCAIIASRKIDALHLRGNPCLTITDVWFLGSTQFIRRVELSDLPRLMVIQNHFCAFSAVEELVLSRLPSLTCIDRWFLHRSQVRALIIRDVPKLRRVERGFCQSCGLQRFELFHAPLVTKWRPHSFRGVRESVVILTENKFLPPGSSIKGMPDFVIRMFTTTTEL